MITENLSTLKIHKLTQAQYDRELAAGNTDATAIYLTPDEQIQPDWNENDTTSAAYVKNKTHYDTSELKTLLDNGIVTINSNKTTGTINKYYSENALKYGTFYKAVLNGVEYDNLPVRIIASYLCLGNLNITSSDFEDTGEPFAIVYMPAANRLYLYFKEETTECTLSLYEHLVEKVPTRFMNFDYVSSIQANPFSNNLGEHAFNFGYESEAIGKNSSAFGTGTEAVGKDSISTGLNTKSVGQASVTIGDNTRASHGYQLVTGRYNQPEVDIENATETEYEYGQYVHIVGNGTSSTARSNAHTLDWEGNAWYQGSVEATALILTSPNGTRFSITVGDDGVLTSTEITA